MSKRDTSLARENEAAERASLGISPWAKAAVSLVLIVHLTAVVIAPLAVACDTGTSSSPAVAPLRRWLNPYVTFMFLNHGYFFFAPEPGPNHLVDYKVEFDDGRPAVEGRFPNLKEQRPRLLYHRYFMLSESLFARFVPAEKPLEPSPPPLTATQEDRARHELDKVEYARIMTVWQQQRKAYESMRESVSEHLRAKYGGGRVTITRVEHRPPMPAEVSVLGKPLNAPEFYINLPETSGGGRP